MSLKCFNNSNFATLEIQQKKLFFPNLIESDFYMFNKIFESRLQNNFFKNKDLRGNTSIESTNYGLVDVLILYSSNLSIKDCQSNMQKELARKGKRIVCFIPTNDFESFVSANNFNLIKDVEEQFVTKAFVYNLMHFGNESYSSVFSTI